MAADGTFAIEHLPAGTYTLSLWAAGEARIVQTPGIAVGDAGAAGIVLRW